MPYPRQLDFDTRAGLWLDEMLHRFRRWLEGPDMIVPILDSKGDFEMQHHLALLGWSVKDKVTGYSGVVTHIGIDLFGCAQAIVLPKASVDKDGVQKLEDSRWFDLTRLEAFGSEPVMNPISIKGDRQVAGSDNHKPTK